MSELSILSMGWGVQTWTMAAMMALGEMARPDYIVFADTKHEGQATYEFIRQWAPWLGEHGLNLVEVSSNRTEVVRQDWSKSVLIPAFTVSSKDGAHGQVMRQCTHDWKITPIRHWLREEMARRGIKVAPGVVECWLGISWDEVLRRMKDSDVAYIKNRYPLVERRMTREACVAWCVAHNLPVPPKSACTFCPYKGASAWKALKQAGGPDWQEALAVDAAIRNKRAKQHGLLYVHSGCKPLADAVSIPEDFGAKQLGFDDPGCDSGFCFN